jgi:hypothetical protein
LSAHLLGAPRMAVAGEDGSFTFRGVPEGHYVIAAQKPAWVPVAHGVKSALSMAGGAGQGVPVAVKEGEAVRDVTLRLQRGAVISGVVRMPGGGVAAGVSVQALMTSRVDGTRVASMTAVPGTTDDRGRYRIYGLAPGEYVVQVRSELVALQSTEIRQVLPSEVQWAEAVRAQAAAALAPGTTPADPPPAPALGPTVAYSTTYFPGTAYLSDAAAVPLRAGDERVDVDVEMRMVPTATVSGLVTGRDGQPVAGAMISLTVPGLGQEDMFGQILGAARGTSRADGTFVLTGIQPGAYTLTARAAPPTPGGRQTPDSRGAMMAAALAGMASGMGGAASTLSLWARESITVNGQSVGPLGLQLRDGLTVSGTVVFEGSTPPSADAVRVGVAEPSANTGMPDMLMFRMNPSVGQAREDGTFELTGLVPGTYRLSVMMPGLRQNPTAPGEGWMLKSARLGDRELADEGIDLTGGTSLSGLVVTLTDRPSELSGRVLDAASEPFSAFPLVVFSADRAHWVSGSRRIHTVQPATDGSYVIAGLPAGQYYLAAVTTVDTRELASAAFLDSLIASAIRVTLAEGERKVQDVRLAGG